ncbi:hypothetical protein BC833DRAFT_513482, partial [Globomyces pollinis-pini]
ETAVYRTALSPQEIVKFFPHSKTVQDLFMYSVKAFPNNPFLGTRFPSLNKGQVVWSDYQWKTYGQFNEDRLNFGAGLINLYNKYVTEKAAQWFIGIFALNRYEWIVSDLGAGAYSIPNVALYDTLGPETSEFILNHAEVPILVTSSDKVAAVLELSPKCPYLKVVIVMESLFKDQPSNLPIFKKWGAQIGVHVVSFSEVLELGKKFPVAVRMPGPEDLLCLSYTSGTTGNPKAAMLTHSNMISTLRGLSLITGFDDKEVHISYLPLAHIFERVNILGITMVGGSAGFFRGDVTLLIEDIGVLRPTVFASVPRLLNRIYDKIIQGALHSGSAVKAALFTRALDAKLHYLKQDGSLNHSIWDPLVFNKVKAVLGGRVKLIITASAPISSNTLNFLRVITGGQVIEAYGQTESCGGSTVSWKNDFSTNNVGIVTPNTEVKLVSVPEMNYFAKDLKGEIWLRGNGVFKGYYKDKAKTAETITEDGWLKTGDIGTIDAQGHVSIVDRKKNIFKLAQGEYVAPEKLENIYLKSPFVAQIYVHGDSLQAELVGVIVPDQDFSIGYAIKEGLLPANTPIPPPATPGAPPSPLLVKLCENPKFKAAIFKDLTAYGKADKVRGFEFLKAIHLEPEMFSTESGLLTPTMKMKRPEAVSKYRSILDGLYKELDDKRVP